MAPNGRVIPITLFGEIAIAGQKAAALQAARRAAGA
jgi:hypothetical protein